ncbi:MAG: DUF1697 domain-containing protein [Candidatus Micrarchaeota archaeon]
MNKFICLIRGINVSGQKLVNMKELTKLLETLELRNVKTYIQSGNIIFESEPSDCKELEKKIASIIEQRFGFSVNALVKSKDGFLEIAKNNPFLGKPNIDLTKLHITFLSKLPAKIPKEEIEKVKSSSEEFLITKDVIYLYLPDGYGRTKISNNFFEKKLVVNATTRNWKTMMALTQMI